MSKCEREGSLATYSGLYRKGGESGEAESMTAFLVLAYLPERPCGQRAYLEVFESFQEWRFPTDFPIAELEGRESRCSPIE